MQYRKSWKKIKKGAFRMGSALLPCVILLMVWSYQAEETAHFAPKYEQTDIKRYAEKSYLTEADYRVLFCQTGLGKMGVDALWQMTDEKTTIENKQMNGIMGDVLEEDFRVQSLEFLQNRFFAKTDIRCEPNTILTRQENLVNMPEYTSDWRKCYPALEDGDILITFCCHFFGWRNGHAGMVVDAKEGMVLEARSLGSNSTIASVSGWANYPSVAVLRLKNTSEERRREIAIHAAKHYKDLPYRLSAGILPEVEGTQCAHLVYRAYREFGYDLDSDRGVLVTPADLFESAQLEVVQIYGIDPHYFMK